MRAPPMLNCPSRANLSPSACHRRVQQLEKSGFIRDYVALLDPRKLERPATIFVEITLSGQADEVLEAFERERGVAKIPDVLECHLMAGTADYLLNRLLQMLLQIGALSDTASDRRPFGPMGDAEVQALQATAPASAALARQNREIHAGTVRPLVSALRKWLKSWPPTLITSPRSTATTWPACRGSRKCIRLSR